MMRDHYDLIVVGTSFASSFFLKKYLEKSSRAAKVLVLERGELHPHKERLKIAQDKAFGDNSFISSPGRGRAYLTNNEDKPWIFDPNFGGSSNCWTGCTPRFLPNDFKLKSLYNIGYDWPITYDDLEPYYCEVEEIMAIAGPEVTPYAMSKGYPQAPHALSSVDRLIQQKFGSLYISQPTARASAPIGKRNSCCSSSICHLCPVNAKFTIENSLLDLYTDERVEVRYNAQAYALDLNNGIAKSIEYMEEGKKRVVKSDVFALGANAIFNAHIMLNSGDDNSFIGKGLCEQVGYYAYFYLDGLDNLGGSSTITANGYMLYDGKHRENIAACIIENHNDAFVRGDFGKWRQMAKFKFVFEDIPNNENRVILSDNELIPYIKYSRYSDYVERGYNALQEKIGGLFDFLPIEKIVLDPNSQLSESHILSTTRMGTSNEDSVIDKNLLHHKYRNVFLLGGGSFPSISPANPTLTLSALSLMAADNNF